MKRVLFKVILPLLVIAVWMNMCYWICVDGNGVNWFQFCIIGGVIGVVVLAIKIAAIIKEVISIILEYARDSSFGEI